MVNGAITPEEAVERLYQGLLGRTRRGDPAADNAVFAVRSGRLVDVIDGLLASPEYAARA